jgi:hypothetical protein
MKEISAIVTKVSQPIVYLGCKGCKTKISTKTCPKCNKKEFIQIYRLQLKIATDTIVQNVSSFNQTSISHIIGINADNFQELSLKNKNLYELLSEWLTGKKFVFNFKNYQEQNENLLFHSLEPLYSMETFVEFFNKEKGDLKECENEFESIIKENFKSPISYQGDGKFKDRVSFTPPFIPKETDLETRNLGILFESMNLNSK